MINKKLHLIRCIINKDRNLIDELDNAEIYAKNNYIDCLIVYLEDSVLNKWYIYMYTNRWKILDKGNI